MDFFSVLLFIQGGAPQLTFCPSYLESGNYLAFRKYFPSPKVNDKVRVKEGKEKERRRGYEGKGGKGKEKSGKTKEK